MNDHQDLFDRVKDCWEFSNYPEALILLRSALETDPENARIHYLMGVCLAEIGEYAEAQDCLENALRYDPNDKKARTVLESLHEHVKEIEQKKEKEKEFRPTAFDYEPRERETKVCPSCKREIDVHCWRCRLCGHYFRTRITTRILIISAIAIVSLIGIRYGFVRFYGLVLQPAEVHNDAGALGERITVSDTQWNCAGMGLLSARGLGYHATAVGKVVNSGTGPIEKAVFTIHFFGRKVESTFVWFDIYSWKPGQEITFDLPVIHPPYKSFRCEFRIKEVKLYEPGAFDESERTSIFIPQTNSPYEVNQFPVWRFQDETRIIHDSDTYYKIEKTKWTFGKFLKSIASIIPALLLSFICMILAVILTNYCQEGKKWNDDLKLDAYASALIVISFMVLNTVSVIVSNILAMIAIIGAVIGAVIFIVKVLLFYLFFRRDLIPTMMLFIFYFCLVLGIRGLLMNFF